MAYKIPAAAAGAGAFYIQTGSGNPVASTTYYLSTFFSPITFTAATNAYTNIFMAKAGTITACYGFIQSLTPGSNENVTIALRLNNTSNTNVTTTLQLDANRTFSNNALSITVAAGDFINPLIITPAWVLAPLSSSLTLSFVVT